MSDAIKVTVDEPVTREVTLEQVREYLRAKGWVLRVLSDGEGMHVRVGYPAPAEFSPCVELWICQGWSDPLDPAVHIGVFPGGCAEAAAVRAIRNIAEHERRSPAQVLREIAGDGGTNPPEDVLRLTIADAWTTVDAVLLAGQRANAGSPPSAIEEIGLEAMLRKTRDALGAILHDDGAGQPRAKSQVEARADDQEAASEGYPLSFEDALRNARIARSDAYLATREDARHERRLDAAAWLLVAQRLLEREVGR